MKILITGGKMRTVVEIDSVRTMTIENKAGGGTAVHLAKYFALHDCRVTLVLFINVDVKLLDDIGGVDVIYYESYFDFFEIMEMEVRAGRYDAIIHSVAVSDYVPDGVFVGDNMMPANSKGKLSSSYSQIFCKLIPTKKILTLFKKEWGFKGIVIGFKLETDIGEDELIQKARQKIVEGSADVVIANLQESYRAKVYMVEGSCVNSGKRRFLGKWLHKYISSTCNQEGIK